MKSIKNKIFIALSLVASMFISTSCLNDDSDYWKDDVAGKAYATVLKPQLQSMGLKPVAGYVNYSFMINIATDELPTSDITIVMAKDPAAVTNYNTLKGTSYKVFPNLEILNPNIVIAKGTRTAMVNCRVWGAEALDACDKFIAAVSIQSVSGDIAIAGNMKSYLVSLPISNPYEGNYHASGTFTHPTAGVRTIDEDKVLSTVDCKTVKTTVGDLGGYDAIFTVNADNTVTVTGGLSASQLLVQSGVNTYTPATKTFVVNYYYVGGGGNRVISETLVRL
jgi:hypothetical protein